MIILTNNKKEGMEMKKILLYMALSISLTFTALSFQVYSKIHKFDAGAVKSNIGYLSSNTFKGRLAGTVENRLAAKHIENYFKDNKLHPFKGSYTNSFNTYYPHREDSSPYLRVINREGRVVARYNYGIDYKEDMLNFRKNSISFTKDNRAYFTEEVIHLIIDGNPFLFFAPPEDNLSFRSSFVKDADISMCIMVTKKTMEEINEFLRNNYTVECYIPFTIMETTVDNVLGVIRGRNPSKPPVILSAHFDHLGTDLKVNIYHGALDNASGTAFIMEMVRYLKSLGEPERDIVFIAFNAEEFGLLGSKNFVDKYVYELKGSKVFNFDMIGSDDGVPLCIMGSKSDTSKTSLISSVTSTAMSQKIFFNYLFEDASDHEPFRKHGIDAITFCDNDMRRIHTPEDTVEHISITAIERCFQVASREVIKYGYNSNFILIYPSKVLIISIISTAGIILLLKLTERNN
jgi:hypothetical protein